MKPKSVAWSEAGEPLIVKLNPWDHLDGEAYLNTTDYGRIPSAKLVELGIPLRYALNPAHTLPVEIGTLSYPFQRALAGEYTSYQVWKATPAFFDTYKTPQAMVAALRLAALHRVRLELPTDGSPVTFTDEDGIERQARITAFGPQVWPSW